MTLLDTRPGAAPATATAPRVPADVRRIAFSAAATALSVVALVAMLKVGAWLPKSLALVAGAFVLGVGLRAARLPRPAVVAIQAVVGLCAIVALQASEDATWSFVPGPGAFEDLADVWSDGVGDLQRFNAPGTASVGITTVLLVSVAAVAIVVDACSIACRRPDIAGLILVVFFAVPHVFLENGLRGAWFALLALGFMLMAFDGNSDRIRTWGDETIVAAGGGSRTLKIGASVLVLSLAIPAALPSLTGGLFRDSGIGYTPPQPIQTLDPLMVMRAYLVRPADDPLFEQTTDSNWPGESYVQSVVLDVFTGKKWMAGNRNVLGFDALVPDSSGTSPEVPTAPFHAELAARKDFTADYAGMPRPVGRIDIGGKWKVSPATSDVLSFGGRSQISGKSWTVDGYDRDPIAKNLDGQIGAEVPALAAYLTLPKLPPIIEAEAKRITKGAKGSVEIGRKLQDYFANPKNTTYTLAPAGSGVEAISAFLASKQGYAEQTAATMAVMARVLGIPARLGVGFTAGQPGQGGARVVGAHDAHAWPELFLPKAGWTRFEPTPARAPGKPLPLHWLAPGVDKPPPRQNDKPQEQPPPPPQPEEIAPQPQQAPADHQPNDVPKVDEPNTALRVMLWGLFLALLLGSPRILRTAVTRRRWVRVRPKGTDGAVITRIAWLELRDAAIDLGYAWPKTRTPRQAGRELAERGHLEPGTVADLDALLHNVEQVRYAPPASMKVDAVAMRSAVVKVRWELAAAAPRTNRVQAVVLPRSLVPMIRDAAKAVLQRATARQKPAGRRRAGVRGRRLVR